MLEYYQRELKDKQRQLENISRECSECLRKEQDLNKKISECHSRISRDKDGKDRFAKYAKTDIPIYERELNNVMRRHQDLERKRADLLRDIERVQRSIEYSLREQEMAQRQKAKEEAERAERERRRQKREAEAAAYRAQKAAQANKSSEAIIQEKYQDKPTRKRHPILFFLLFLFLFGVFSPSDKSNKVTEGPKSEKTSEAHKVSNEMGVGQGHVMTEGSKPVAGKPELERIEMLVDHIGLTVENIESLYGHDYTVEWGYRGGYEMIYENGSTSFLFDGYGNQDISIPEKSNIIYGITSNKIGCYFTDAIYVGMPHEELLDATNGDYDAFYASEYGGEGIYLNGVELLQGLAEITIPDGYSKSHQYKIITVEKDGKIVHITMTLIDGEAE